MNKTSEFISNILIALVIVVAINIISGTVHFRIDATSDRQFTLTEGTKKIAMDAEAPVEIKVFFSKSAENVPIQIKNHAGRVMDLMKEIVGENPEFLSVQFIDPRPDTDEELDAMRYGLQGVALPSSDEFYFGAVFLQGKQEISIPFFDLGREAQLEYDLAEAILSSSRVTKAKIGVMSGLPVLGSTPDPTNPYSTDMEGWVVFDELKKSFELTEVKTDVLKIPEDLDSLILIHPTNLSDATLFAIDQHVMRGGNLIALVDPFSRAQLGIGGQQALMSGQFASNLKRLFDAYGVETSSEVVADPKNPTTISLQGQAFPYPAMISLTGENMNADQPMTASLNNMLFSEGGEVSKKDGSMVEFISLIESSESAKTGISFTIATQGPNAFTAGLTGDARKRTLAALIKAKWKSAFPTVPEGADGSLKKAHQKEAKEEGLLLVIADTDFISDDNAVRSYRMFGQRLINPLNDNLAFFLNATETLSGKDDLIGIRTRAKISRPFTRLQNLQEQAQQEYQAEEQRLSSRLEEVQKKLSEINSSQVENGKVTLNDEQMKAIKEFRKEQAEVKRELRNVRKKLREDIEALGSFLKLVSMLAIPIGVFVLGLLSYNRRSSAKNRGKRT